MKQFLEKNNIKIRSISNLAAVGLFFAAGLFYVLMIDLKVKFRTETAIEGITPISIWLFFAIIFAVGGGIFYFFGDSQKHKKVLTLVLKAIGIILGIGYIFFAIKFNGWVDTSGKVLAETIPNAHLMTNISLALNIGALVAASINYVFSILYINEDY